MSVFKQILREFLVPLTIAIAWTLYNLAALPWAEWSIRSFVNVFGPTFFFVSWLVAQWFRVRKQQRVESGLNDIETNIKRTVEQLDEKTADLVNYITGGDSVCYLCGPNEASNIWAPILLVHVGKHPLYDVKVRVVDIDIPPNIIDGKIVPDTSGKREWSRSFGDLIPGHGRSIKEALVLGHGDSHRYNIFFTARNGSFTQILRSRKVDGIWRHALQVRRGNTIVHEHISEGYPRNENGQIDWN